MIRRPLRRALLVAAALAAWSCASAKEARMDEARFGKAERVYVGRFSLEVPAGAERLGDELDIRHVRFREVVFAEPLDEAFGRAWAAKLAQIDGLKARRRRPHHIVGEVHSQHELEPRFSAVLYHTDNVKIAVEYAALRQVGAAGLWLTRPAGDVGDLAPTLAALRTMGKAWQPRAPGTPAAKGHVFHLPHGAIALPFDDYESAKASFKGGPLEVEIELSTESTPEPRSGGLMARFGEAVARAGAAFAAGASVVRNGGRTAAGLKGEEFVMRGSEDGKLYFLWEFKGEKDSGAKPEIQLQMITKDERQKEKMAFWDALVDSLRPASAP